MNYPPAPNTATQKERLGASERHDDKKGKFKKKKKMKMKHKKSGHDLMDSIVEKAQQLGKMHAPQAGLPGQKTIVKIG